MTCISDQKNLTRASPDLMDTGLRDRCHGFKLSRGLLVEGRAATLPIRDHLMLEDILSLLAPRRVLPLGYELALQRSKNNQCRCVPAIALVAHAGRDTVRGKPLLIGPCRILTP